MNDLYASQKKHLSQKKQIRVWVDADKYERFKKTVAKQKQSIYGLINTFVDEYLSENEKNN